MSPQARFYFIFRRCCCCVVARCFAKIRLIYIYILEFEGIKQTWLEVNNNADSVLPKGTIPTVFIGI